MKKAKYKEIIFKELINLKEDGSFNLNLKYFDYCTGLTMINLTLKNCLELNLESLLAKTSIVKSILIQHQFKRF